MSTPNLKTFLINSIADFPKGKRYFVICNKDIILASRSNSKSTCDQIEFQIIGSDEFWTESDAKEINWTGWPLLCIDPRDILLDTDEYLAKDHDAWMSEV